MGVEQSRTRGSELKLLLVQKTDNGFDKHSLVK